MKSALFSRFEENLRTVWRFWQFWRSQMRFGQNVLRMTCNFHEKRSVCPFWREFEASVTILTTFTLTNAILPKRARHDLKRAFCTIFMKSAPFSRFEDNFRPVWLFWELWRSKMRFGQNVLRMTWNERFVQFSWKAHCFPVLKRIWGTVLARISGQCDDFENFDAHKFDWRKRAAHDLKRAFCTIFMESALFYLFGTWKACDALKWPAQPEKRDFNCHEKRTVCLFGENLSLWRFWQLWQSQMRFGQNVLRMTWKKSVLYNFHEKRTVFPFWILTEFFMKSALFAVRLLPKRARHDLKKAFCQCDDFDKTCCALWRSQIWFGQNVLRMTWKERFVQFSWKAHCFPVLKRIWGSVTILRTLTSKMRFGQNVLRMTWKKNL